MGCCSTEKTETAEAATATGCCGGGAPSAAPTNEWHGQTMKAGCPCCGGRCNCGPNCPCRMMGHCAAMASGCSSNNATLKYNRMDDPCRSKKCMGAFIAGLLAAMVMFLFEGFWHGQYLMPFYQQSRAIWRPLAEMQSLMGWYAGVLIAMGLIISLIFSKNYEGRGLPEGVRFGFYLGLLLGIANMAAFVHLPISINLAVLWLCGWIVEGVLVGITLALTYMAFNKKAGMCGSVKQGCH